jgi:WD40 repeat protein
MQSASHRRSFNVHWQDNLSDYVTAICWSTNRNLLAACSAAGEVLLWQDIEEQSFLLQSAGDTSTDCLNFSYDGQFLAAGRQDGVLRIWNTNSLKLVAELENPRRWIDQLAWHPSCNQVAFSLGKKVQIWDAESRSAIAELNFENSSIFGMAWHPQGHKLAAGGQGGEVLMWKRDDIEE